MGRPSFWTKERCREEALKHTNVKDWTLAARTSVDVSRKNKWMTEFTSHMEYFQQKKTATIEVCKESAKQYHNRTQWSKMAPYLYRIACLNKWQEECCKHMVYVYKEKGYWNKERCSSESIKYKSKVEWRKNSRTSYTICQRRGWFKELSQHFYTSSIFKKKYATIEQCKEDSLKYKSKTEWFKKSNTIYCVAKINGWSNECCQHMKGNKTYGCVADALRFKNESTWKKESKDMYTLAKTNGWLETCQKHMSHHNPSGRKKNGYWTKKRCINECCKYKTKSEWIFSCGSSYNIARSNGWLEDCYKEMFKK